MCCKWGLQGKPSIKASPYGTLFQCCTRAAGRVQRNLRAIGPRSECVASGGGDLQGIPSSLFVGHRFSVVRGPRARCDAIFYLSVRYYTSVRFGRWRGCGSYHYMWWSLAEFRL